MPVLKLMERKSFQDYASGLQASSSIVVPIRRRIDISSYSHAGLLVRCHELNISSGGKFRFDVASEAPSDEDPQLDFVTSAFANVTIDDSFSAPSLIVETLNPDNMGAMIAVSLFISRGASTNDLDGIFSIDLHLRMS